MARVANELLFSAVQERRPVVLILGQNAWADGRDGILTRVAERLGISGELQHGWADVFGANELSGEFYQWLAERFSRRVHSPSLQSIAELPYSAVFTSALDPTLYHLLATPRREPQVILTGNETLLSVRSLVRPPLYYLFSRAGERDPQARPPSDLISLNARRTQHALPMLNVVLDTATVVGLIIVDGYSPGQDWLRMDDLLGNFGSAGPNQILWFGGRPQLEGSDAALFEAAVESGRIVVEQERLACLVSELQSTGKLADLAPPEAEEAGIVSFGRDDSLLTTPEERLRVEAVASIVDDSWTAFLPPLGPDADYEMFRHFHGAFEGPRLLVEGVRRNFAIQRDFEGRLLNLVNGAIANHTSIDSPIIVKGQSGTGKSVALARVVARVRESRNAAVLYTLGRIPQSQDISYFCERAEDAGAKVTLIVCDANRDVDRYHDLLVGLRSRGRRVVVVGSQYQSEESPGYLPEVSVEAPAELSTRELDSLSHILSRYFDFNGIDVSSARNILAFIYRCLPPSRERIRAGLSDEARSTEQTLRTRGGQPLQVNPLTEMHLALIESGLLDSYRPLFDEQQAEILEQGGDAAGQIIDLVMVAGSLNCYVPFNLLLRAVKSRFEEFDLSLIAELFRGLDLFRWITDAQGNDLLVAPRLTLEAQLICQRRIGNIDVEANRLVELISAARLGVERSQEISFLLNILQQVHNDGPRGDRYKKSYIDIGRALTVLRGKTGISDPRLMLQESAFRRAAIRSGTVDDVEHLSLLEEARDAVQRALDLIDNGQIWAPLRTKQNLMVERATVYGFLANYWMNHRQLENDIWQSYQAARSAIVRAVSVADTYHPLDIALWTPADLLESAHLEEWQRAELAADIYSTLHQIEPEALPPSQRNRFNERRMKVGQALRDFALTQEAYDELESSGSTAGYYLRARSYAPDLGADSIEVISNEDSEKAKCAAEFLKARMNKIEGDVRCLSLLFECRWITEMRRRPLRGRRQPLPTNDTLRREFLNIAQSLNHASGEAARYSVRYIEGVLTWLVGDYSAAGTIFRNLDRDTEYEAAGRVITRHVISDEDGTPTRFLGRIERQRREGHWIVRVDGLGQTLSLLSRDFPNQEIAYGRNVGGFAIAFSFLGPIAEPIR